MSQPAVGVGCGQLVPQLQGPLQPVLEHRQLVGRLKDDAPVRLGAGAGVPAQECQVHLLARVGVEVGAFSVKCWCCALQTSQPAGAARPRPGSHS
jgi:hypothetical protein